MGDGILGGDKVLKGGGDALKVEGGILLLTLA